jgi:hypothetical protein
MCGIPEKLLGVTCVILILVNIIISTISLVRLTDQGDKLEYGAQWLNEQLNIEMIATYLDLSHYPTKPSEFYERPELGECCNNMCKGSRCFAGSAFLLRDDHCNKCCFKLLTPDSCSEYSCTCYANDQSSSNLRLP